LKARVRKKTHKYGIEVPTSLVLAKELERINGNTLWTDALKLEMHNVEFAFEVLEDGKHAPQGWTKASGHTIWDLKMDYCFPAHLQELRCGWFYVRQVLNILAWMCMLTFVGSGW
jgi:hypothetical protein